MSSFRRSHRNNNERASFAVQSDPNDLVDLNADISSNYNIKYATPQTFNKTPSVDPQDSNDKSQIVQDPEKE
jgi:hypothetical protein